MASKLSKLAAYSAALRNVSIQKQAGVLTGAATLAGKAVVGAGKLAVKHPVKTLVGASAAAGSVGQAKRFNEGFNPDASKAYASPYSTIYG